MPKYSRIIISGGPATGKTSLIAGLENLGYNCFHEVSREIIKQSLDENTDILPWKDLPAFSKRVVNQRIAQFAAAKAGLNFYDRSVVDSLAYMHKDGQVPLAEWSDWTKKNAYHPQVFVTPPWREIFENDNERRESWETLLDIHQHILWSYQNLGYSVIIVPELTVSRRIEFIFEHL